MKNFACLFIYLFLLSATVFSQKTTFILLRHAEKDISATADKRNPDLSIAGKQRAENLIKTISKYQPQEIFSTTYNRTRSTINPLSFYIYAPFRLQTQFYDASEQETFTEQLLQTKSSCVVVVGHSNTIPALANLLIKQTKYKDLAENEYNKIFIIEVIKKRNKASQITDSVIEY